MCRGGRAKFAHMDGTYVVGVTGGSGSGKTTFVRELRERLGDLATFFSQDDYYRHTDDIARDGAGVHNFDLPSSIDSARMAADVARVVAGETLRRREYTFQTIYADGATGDAGDHSTEREETSTGRVGEERALAPAPVLIVEGLFALHEAALRQLMDLTVYIDASDVAKLTRRIRRDRIERQLPLEDVLYRYERHVRPAYVQYIEPYRAGADLIINNDERGFERGLAVLVDHLRARAARQAATAGTTST